MADRRIRRNLLLFAGAFLLALLLVVAVKNRKNEEAPPGQEIRYDDFGFTVTGARRSRIIGLDAGSLTAEGIFVVVTLQVRNHAELAPFRFSHSFVYLEDDQGREFPHSEAGLAALEDEDNAPDPCREILRGLQSCLTEIPFDVPEDATGLRLRISLGGGLSDLLDLIFYGDKALLLEAP